MVAAFVELGFQEGDGYESAGLHVGHLRVLCHRNPSLLATYWLRLVTVDDHRLVG